eukprot:1981025-Pleurochrysis_carterae.AAC.2
MRGPKKPTTVEKDWIRAPSFDHDESAEKTGLPSATSETRSKWPRSTFLARRRLKRQASATIEHTITKVHATKVHAIAGKESDTGEAASKGFQVTTEPSCRLTSSSGLTLTRDCCVYHIFAQPRNRRGEVSIWKQQTGAHSCPGSVASARTFVLLARALVYPVQKSVYINTDGWVTFVFHAFFVSIETQFLSGFASIAKIGTLWPHMFG